MSFVLDHVALAAPDLARAGHVLAEDLGGEPAECGQGPGFRFGQWRFAGGGRLEVIEPAGPPDGFVHRFLARHGPGVHHVTFKVTDLHRACARAVAAGYRIVGFDDRAPGWKEAFLHPREAQGIVVQLAESHPELEDPAGREWFLAPRSEQAPPAVGIRALHLVAGSVDAARRQWEHVLGGSAVEDDAGITVTWPASPIALVVTASASATPGPRAIEIAAGHGSARGLGDTATPHPILGAPLLGV